MRPPLIFSLFFLITVVDAGFFDFISKLAGGGSNSNNNSGSSSKSSKLAPVTDDRAKRYLQEFGYVAPSNSLGSSSSHAGVDFSDVTSLFKRAVLKFQEFAGLKKTGVLDTETKKKMAEPRCGVTDVLAISSGGAAFKWRKNRLTYSIENFSSDLPRDDVRKAIREGYEMWAAVTPLEFEEIPAGSGADIKVRFGTGNHNDPWPFDGKGGVLAHATMPENGALHFDDDENWTYMDAKKIASGDYTDLLAVAIHEGGHTLGLSHSRDETSIMAPFYHETVDSRGNYKKPTLKSDDISSIQDIYGKPTSPKRPSGGSSFDSGSSRDRDRTTQPPKPKHRGWLDRLFGNDDDPTTTPRPSPPTTSGSRGGLFGSGDSGRSGSGSAGCPYSVDAFTPSDDFSYLFSGSTVYALAGRKVHKSYRVTELFSSAPSHVDAAVFNPTSGMMLLFGDGRVYGYYFSRIRGIFQMDSAYPKRLPSDISFTPHGALRWINGHQILLSSGDEFSVYDEFWNQSTMKNRVSSYFPNMPIGVKGIESPSGSTVTAFTSNQKTNGSSSLLDLPLTSPPAPVGDEGYTIREEENNKEGTGWSSCSSSDEEDENTLQQSKIRSLTIRPADSAKTVNASVDELRDAIAHTNICRSSTFDKTALVFMVAYQDRGHLVVKSSPYVFTITKWRLLEATSTVSNESDFGKSNAPLNFSASMGPIAGMARARHRSNIPTLNSAFDADATLRKIILRYELCDDARVSQPPLYITTYWKCEEVDVLIDYQNNECPITTPLLNLVFTTKEVSSVTSDPTATWSADNNTLFWTITELSRQRDGAGPLKSTEHTGSPSLTSL
ncbi:unnamed protein product [Cylicocyclus nassatus]|uniref:Peptidase metallopeptidase domain-containing protein n=1 Tax=Cylicocyclus nassatus TaxID=53992 RepID=A0AA36DLE9_CYLNA|nr:unnamed protein product [Cylicocyclus nassatus]